MVSLSLRSTPVIQAARRLIKRLISVAVVDFQRDLLWGRLLRGSGGAVRRDVYGGFDETPVGATSVATAGIARRSSGQMDFPSSSNGTSSNGSSSYYSPAATPVPRGLFTSNGMVAVSSGDVSMSELGTFLHLSELIPLSDLDPSLDDVLSMPLAPHQWASLPAHLVSLFTVNSLVFHAPSGNVPAPAEEVHLLLRHHEYHDAFVHISMSGAPGAAAAATIARRRIVVGGGSGESSGVGVGAGDCTGGGGGSGWEEEGGEANAWEEGKEGGEGGESALDMTMMYGGHSPIEMHLCRRERGEGGQGGQGGRRSNSGAGRGGIPKQQQHQQQQQQSQYRQVPWRAVGHDERRLVSDVVNCVGHFLWRNLMSS
jgi:hypothetical protein